jgi:RNA polymerase sigma factor (sigma-70 family)
MTHAMNATAVDHLIRRELPAAARGNRDAYGRMVAASQNTVTAVALAITRDVPASEDIAQEAFLSAWQNLRRLKTPDSFLPWLRQITRNLARDHLRGGKRRPLDGEAAELAIAHAADPSASPMQQLIDDEREAVAADLISELPAESREVLLLYYREGQSSQQVATLLGMSDAAVRKRLSRARQTVREGLLQRFGEFARGSAPGIAFTAVVAGALATAAPPAAAATIAASVGASATAKGAAKIGMGSAGGVAFALGIGVAAMYVAGRYLLRFAVTEAERSAIRHFVVWQCITAAAFVGALLYALARTQGWVPLVAVTVAGFVVINYQALVWLPRIMAPCFARMEAADPVGAARARRGFTWAYGWIGSIIGTVAGFGSVAWLLVMGDRLG